MFWFMIYNRYVGLTHRASENTQQILSFDATYLYQVTFILLYNLVFTSLPVGILGGMLTSTFCARQLLIDVSRSL